MRSSQHRKINIKEGQTYLNFPVTRADSLKKMRIIYQGKVLDEVTLKLTDTQPDFWTFSDVTPYQSKMITLEVEGTVAPKGLGIVHADAGFPGQNSLYHETLRPQLHFSSPRGNNNPNGLIYYNGEYHPCY